jgi:maleamate amidohydrolase
MKYATKHRRASQTRFGRRALSPAVIPKLAMQLGPDDAGLLELDPRVGRLPTEKLFRKRFASCFKGTYLHEMLTGLGIDTLIITGVSPSHCVYCHCVYATCRDATDSFRVIVPREAVGERCEVMHLVNLWGIDIDLADVMPVDEVTGWLQRRGNR